MPYSTQRVVSDGSLVLLSVSIGYLERSHIRVFFDSVENNSLWSWVGPTSNQIAFSPAVPNGVEVLVARKTDLSAPYHVFTQGAQFTAESLDEDIAQILYIAQEATEQALTGDFFQNVNMHNHRIINAADATDPQDVMTLGQAQEVMQPYVDDAEAAALAASNSAAAADISEANALVAAAQAAASVINAGVSVRDYGAIGDGLVDDTAAIQAALNSGYKRVIVPAGTYLHGQVTLPSGVSLVGTGGTLKAKSGTYYQILVPNGSVNSAVEGITFDASGLITAGSPTGETACISSATTSGSMSGLRVTNNNFLNIPTTLGQRIHALQLNYGTAVVSGNYTPKCGGDIYNFNNGYFIVSNNTAMYSADGGIAFNNRARGVIAGNLLYKCDLGIGAGPEGTDASPEHSMLIVANEFIACDQGINMGWFSYAGKTAPRNVTIVGNTFDRCKSDSLRYDGATASWCAYLTISGNTFSNSGSTDYDGSAGLGRGVVVNNAKYTTITGNTFAENLGMDISTNAFEGVTISSNVINAGAYAGDGVSAIACSNSRGLISNNVVYGRPIWINATYIRVNGNTVQGVPGSTIGAVVVTSNAGSSQITVNTFTDCGVGIYMPSLAGYWSADQTGNFFVNCTTNVYLSPLPREGDAYIECYYTGTVDGSNNYEIVHNLGAVAPYKVVVAQAFKKGASGEAAALTLAFVDGTKARFTGGTSGDIARGYLRINKDVATW